MKPLPHTYTASARLSEDEVIIESAGLPGLTTAAPADFGGPGDLWSPETLLVAAVSDCFILTFKAIARASRLDYDGVRCEVSGVLDKLDSGTCFTHINIVASATIPNGADADKAKKLLEKAESNCLITNSLKAEVSFEAEVEVANAS
tara:strand:- start:618 stop:1058 length:441 start_codon:yes stop_codon:yes gene_type:complete